MPHESMGHRRVVEGQTPSTFTYTIDHAALYRWGVQHWRKTILVTDQDDWFTAAVIGACAYRDAWHVGVHLLRSQTPELDRQTPPI